MLLPFGMNAATEWTVEDEVFTVDTLRHEKVGPGTMYTRLYLKSQSTSTHMRVHFLTMDMKGHDNVKYKMELGNDTLLTVERISDVAKRKTTSGNYYFAGVNGDFYITWDPYIGNPNMACYVDGQIAMYDRDEATKYGHFVMDDSKNMWCDHIYQKWTITRADNSVISLSHINYDRLDNELVLYNDKTGHYTKTTGGVERRVRLVEGEEWGINKPFKVEVVGEAVSGGNMPILPNEAVLSASGSREADVLNLKDGEVLTVYFETRLGDYNLTPPNIKEVCGGDVVILQRGEVVYEAGRWINSRDAFNPRTMLGYSEDRSKMVWGLIDGRSSESSGSTYPQGASIMRYAGCYDAVNVDGGGSSGMYIQNLGIVNTPSDGKERAVSNGIYAVLEAPEDNEIAEIRFVDWAMNFPQYGIYTPKFYGYNQYGMLIDTDVQGVTLSCDPKIGEVINNGTTFYGTGDGIGALKAEYNGLTADIPVTVAPSDNVKLRLSNVVLDNKREYTVEVNALVNESEMPMNPSALAWSSDNEAVATVEAGTGLLKGVSNGAAVVTGKVGDFTGTLNVSVEIPEADVMPVYHEFGTAEDWTFRQVGGTDLTVSQLGEGFKLNYVGNGSSRGAYISVDRRVDVWSLPEGLRISVNPGDVSMKKVSVTAMNALGELASSWAFTETELPKNQVSTFNLSFKDIWDLNDIAIYPITITTLRFDLGASAKGTPFEIQVPTYAAVYTDPSGVNEVVNNGTVKLYPNPVAAGMPVQLGMTADVEVYNLNGTLVSSQKAVDAITTETLTAGIYVVRIVEGDKMATTKLIIK